MAIFGYKSVILVENCVQEIEKAWAMVDQSHSKENEAKETIQRLKQEINNLTKMVEQTAGLSMGQEHKSAMFCLTLPLLLGWLCLQCFEGVCWAAGRASSRCGYLSGARCK